MFVCVRVGRQGAQDGGKLLKKVICWLHKHKPYAVLYPFPKKLNIGLSTCTCYWLTNSNEQIHINTNYLLVRHPITELSSTTTQYKEQATQNLSSDKQVRLEFKHASAWIGSNGARYMFRIFHFTSICTTETTKDRDSSMIWSERFVYANNYFRG